MAGTGATHTKPVTKTLRHLRRYPGFWLGVGFIAALVDWILSLASQQGGVGRSVWLTIVFIACVWAARQLNEKRKHKPAIRDVFYDGSAGFIKQLLVMMFWIACLIPFLAGSFLVARVLSPLFPATGIETTGAVIVWLLLAALSLFWVLRTIFAPVLLLNERPGKSIKDSWHITKQRVRWIALYVIGWFFLLLIPTLTIYYLVGGNVIEQSFIVESLRVVARGLVFVLVLPFMSVLIYQLYVHETRRRPRR